MSPAALALAATFALVPAAPAAAPRAPDSTRAGPKAPDLGALPPEQRSRWPLVVQKCGRCHSMDVSLNHGYTPAEWKASMRRMVRIPGAGISPAQADEILEFLRHYSASGTRR